MGEQDEIRHRAVLAGAGLLSAAVLLSLIGSALYKGERNLLVNALLLVSAALAVGAVVVPARRWNPPEQGEVTVKHLWAVKDVLADQVKEQWRAEAVLQSLDDPPPIPARWSVTNTSAATEHRDGPSPISMELTGSGDDIARLAARFRAMRQGRMIIVGGSGAGKTTLAIRLIRELLDTRSGRPDEPVPVLLSIADWAEQSHRSFHEYLARRLAQDYPMLRTIKSKDGPAMPDLLVADGHILPVLDGLEELPPSAQADVITILNWFQAGGVQVILTCRTDDYSEVIGRAENMLTSTMVVQARPMSRQTAAAHLRDRRPPQPGEAWERVLTGLSAATAPSGPLAVLADVCATPLGLWLVRTVYADTRADASALLDQDAFPDPAALRAHLFDRLISALVETRGPGTDRPRPFRPRVHRDPARARRWLSYLAYLMTRLPGGKQPTHEFAWWHLTRAVSSLFTPASHAVIGLVTGSAAGFAAGIATTLATGATPGPESVTVFWIIGGIFLTVVLGLMVTHMIGFIAGPAAGIASGTVFAVPDGPATGIAIVTLMTIPLWALAKYSPKRSEQRANPVFAAPRLPGHRFSSARDLAIVFMAGLGLGLGLGLVTGLTARHMTHPVTAPALGLTIGFGHLLMERTKTSARAWQSRHPMSDQRASHVLKIVSAVTPMNGWRADRTMTLLSMIESGLMNGLLAGLATGVITDPASGLAVGLATGLALDIALTVAAASPDPQERVWLTHLIANRQLAGAGLLPRALMPFLDEAHRLGLLCAIGPSYRFRHAELQDHLATAFEREHL